MNPFELLKNFQNVQGKLTEMQNRLGDLRSVGLSGAGMVRIEMNGRMEVLSVEIDPATLETGDAVMLQDLVLAAFTDATVKIKEKIRDELAGAAGGLGIPPGFMGLG